MQLQSCACESLINKGKNLKRKKSPTYNITRTYLKIELRYHSDRIYTFCRAVCGFFATKTQYIFLQINFFDLILR